MNLPLENRAVCKYCFWYSLSCFLKANDIPQKKREAPQKLRPCNCPRVIPQDIIEVDLFYVNKYDSLGVYDGLIGSMWEPHLVKALCSSSNISLKNTFGSAMGSQTPSRIMLQSFPGVLSRYNYYCHQLIYQKLLDGFCPSISIPNARTIFVWIKSLSICFAEGLYFFLICWAHERSTKARTIETAMGARKRTTVGR